NTVVTGTLNSTPNTTFRIELFFNNPDPQNGVTEGQFFEGFTLVTTDGTGNGSFTATLTGVTLGANQTVTATAIDPTGNTSEFSDPITANTFIVTKTNDAGIGSLRQAILNSNGMPPAAGTTNTIIFNIPGSGVQSINPLSALPTNTSPVVINGYSQPGA